MTKKRTAAVKPAPLPIADQAEAPTSTLEQLDGDLDLELGPSPVEDLEQPAQRPAVSSPPANRLTAAEPKPVVDGALTRCPTCGSTDRTGYANRRELRHEGTTPDGRPYNLVVWRDTRCAACLQLRCDRHYEQTSGQV
jgi:hypothetical protein